MWWFREHLVFAGAITMRVKIGDKFWEFDPAARLGHRDYGACDAPDQPGKRIRIRSTLRGEKRLEIVIHELLHAASWQSSEEWVEQIAMDFARILTRMGYINVNEDSSKKASTEEAG